MAASASPPKSEFTLRPLKVRRDFLFVAKGAHAARPGVVVQARRIQAEPGRAHRGEAWPTHAIGLGFTATRKIGGAVVRNRAKRRLREAARLLLPIHGVPGCAYVFVARAGSGDRPWSDLLDDVKSALLRLHAQLALVQEPPSSDSSLRPQPDQASTAEPPTDRG